MQYLIRLTLVLILASVPAWAAPAAKDPAPKKPAKEAEYKRSDTNFYWKGDVLKAMPDAVIIPAGAYTQKDDSYFIPARKKPAKEIFIQVTNDWLEPITPPDMPASLNIEPDAMQIRESQGDVQVAVPSNPAQFNPATDGMALPNGSVVKTGPNGSAAVLFGGINSARLTPNSEAAVQQTVTPQLRSTEVDLKSGAVFSKVGLRPGEKQDYQVHTPFGIAAARGTDFVSVAMPARTDVWIAQGTVQMTNPDGKTVGTIKSDGGGPLKIVRFPAMPNAHESMMADAETMTSAMNFIPMVNLKLKALRDKMSLGGTLTDNEKIYLGKIKQVPCLIRLAYVEPPAPVMAPPPVPPVVTAPAPAPVTPPPAPAVVAPNPAPAIVQTPAEPVKMATPAVAKSTDTAKKKVKKKKTAVVEAKPVETPQPAAPATPPPAAKPAPTTSVSEATENIPPPPLTLVKAHPTMAPRPDDTSASVPTSKTTVTKPSSEAKPAAPIATGPNDTVP